MAIVSFTLTDDGVTAFQNALACILKFSEDVSLDARRDKLILSALNAIKSAFVSFNFASSHFFRYKYEGSERSPDKFQCLILIRALLSIFRSRTSGDTSRGGSGDSSIERCDVSIEDGPDRNSRFVAKIAWRNGITATHAISFEAQAPVLARFDSSGADNQWSISAHTLRRLMDHFGPKVELLDINTEGEGVLNLTCSTEKQYTKTDGFLNMNVHTSIAVKMDDFDDIDIEHKHHIIINVKDFRAILQHACTTSGKLTAQYSQPWKPLRFSYSENGLYCQFVLMTVGEKEGSNSKKDGTRVHNSRTKRPSFPAGTASTTATLPEAGQRLSSRVEPDSAPADGLPSTSRTGPLSAPITHSGFEMRPPLAPPSTIRMEALYDEDSQWEPVNPEEENPGFVRIEWDESLRPELAFVPIANDHSVNVDEPAPTDVPGGLEPTQRLTQVRKFGLFD
ncbi:cell cycle checkpoint control protein RAD9A [Sporothrix schenckii 1099-18]|uniref:DNA repair protein rad9 n=1 Tax=Sporothrix schenckii 1099-18 TaxID=1397361 RepID=A0A0F2MFH2_SPOSC|nr:cell cycle checkpoint control protein RAD9A [Sporothrix schenckii 1099-18]KJR88387.1 cell cycle checkpoint control protein RAD9A [Sporothrix schenckii 1099-18]